MTAERDQTELVQRATEAAAGRTVCPECADAFLAVLDAIRSDRPSPELN